MGYLKQKLHETMYTRAIISKGVDKIYDTTGLGRETTDKNFFDRLYNGMRTFFDGLCNGTRTFFDLLRSGTRTFFAFQISHFPVPLFHKFCPVPNTGSKSMTI